jgi:hypothetical protein
LVGYELADAQLPGISIAAQPGVTEADLNLIAAGTWTGLQYMEAHFGSAVTTTIKVFDTDRANTGEDSCCMANNETEPGPRYMIRHRAWLGMTDAEKISTGAHELIHIWQAQQGQCLAPVRATLGFWFAEGWTEQAAWTALVDSGWVSAEEEERHTLQFYYGDNYEQAQPDWFTLWESPGNYTHFNSHNGYNWSKIAAMKLIQDYGEDVFLRVCDQARTIGGGFENFPRVFQAALGVPARDFYANLPAFFDSLGLDAGGWQPPQTVPDQQSITTPPPIEIPAPLPDLGYAGCIPPIQLQNGGLNVLCLGARSIQEMAFGINHPIDFAGGEGSISIDDVAVPGDMPHGAVYFRIEGLDRPSRDIIVRFTSILDVYTEMGENAQSIPHEIRICDAQSCVTMTFLIPPPQYFLQQS